MVGTGGTERDFNGFIRRNETGLESPVLYCSAFNMASLLVIKIGGNIIDDPMALKRFLTAFSGLKGARILIHGGGKIATQVAEKLGIETTMVEGRRITDQPMLDVVTMVYGGLVNKQIVAKLQALEVNAIGLTGADGSTVLARKRPVKDIDYGMVGDIEEVDSGQIQFFLRQELTPVFAPITYNTAGDLLNTNADTMASAIAVDMVRHNEVNVDLLLREEGCFERPGR